MENGHRLLPGVHLYHILFVSSCFSSNSDKINLFVIN